MSHELYSPSRNDKVIATRKRKVRLRGLASVFAAFVGLAPGAGEAAETIIPITPPGATDTDQATLPPFPGFYGGFAVLPYDRNTKAYDSNGRALPAAQGLKLGLEIYVPALLYVYPFQLWGGQLASAWVQPIVHLKYDIGAGYERSDQFGLGDAYADVIYWTKNLGLFGATPGPLPLSYGLSVGVGLAAVVPTGGYSRYNALNLGSNVWVVDPNFALTYNSGKSVLGDNTQISARFFYGIPFQDEATRYTSGNIFDIDWSVTEQFSNWRFGLAGSFQTQTTNDYLGLGRTLPNGNKFTGAAIGPVVEYFIPNTLIFIKAKYQAFVVHENFVNQKTLILSTGFKF